MITKILIIATWLTGSKKSKLGLLGEAMQAQIEGDYNIVTTIEKFYKSMTNLVLGYIHKI